LTKDTNVDYYNKELDILILFDGKHELRNNSTVFEELEVSIVDLTVANAVLLATRRGARVK
jgi:hypothetical protein